MTKQDIIAAVAASIENVFGLAARYYWTHECLCDALNDFVYNTPAYRSLPARKAKELMDLVDAKREEHWHRVVFSYEVEGRRYTIEEPGYKLLNPWVVNLHSQSGAYVYRDNPSAFFTLPGIVADDPAAWAKKLVKDEQGLVL